MGNFGFSGDGAAGYELDAIVPTDEFFRDGNIVILAQAHTKADIRYALEFFLRPALFENFVVTTRDQNEKSSNTFFGASLDESIKHARWQKKSFKYRRFTTKERRENHNKQGYRYKTIE